MSTPRERALEADRIPPFDPPYEIVVKQRMVDLSVCYYASADVGIFLRGPTRLKRSEAEQDAELIRAALREPTPGTAIEGAAWFDLSEGRYRFSDRPLDLAVYEQRATLVLHAPPAPVPSGKDQQT